MSTSTFVLISNEVTLSALTGAFFFCVLTSFAFMATTFDFQIIKHTDVPGISLVLPQNEDAFTYITEEEDMDYLPNGSVCMSTDKIGDFISDCGWDQYSCDLL